MTRKQDETRKVKEALKILPYRIKVRHGTGTGSGWIKAYIPKNLWESERKMVETIIAKASDRQMEEYNHILVNWYE